MDFHKCPVCEIAINNIDENLRSKRRGSSNAVFHSVKSPANSYNLTSRNDKKSERSLTGKKTAGGTDMMSDYNNNRVYKDESDSIFKSSNPRTQQVELGQLSSSSAEEDIRREGGI